jgi:DNA topoisomerase I
MSDVSVPGLRYVSDEMPGIRRRRAGRGFVYTNADGKRIRNKAELERIRSIVVPPAWTDVWICPFDNGHILATGRDAKRRKQYRYHPRWRSVRDGAKFDRLPAFAGALGTLRRRVRKDMASVGLPKEKVVATVVALLDSCFARIGNEQYARENGSFGLTTLRSRHAKFDGSTLRLRYRGKAGKDHEAHIDDKRIVYIVRKCQEIPGQVLFQYLDDKGNGTPIGSTDVNDYLRDVTGAEFSAKDFRTWAGTVSASRILARAPVHESAKDGEKQVIEAIDEVASELGNTRAVCRNCYIHPDAIDGYLDASLASAWAHRTNGGNRAGLSADERFVLSFLRSRTRSTKRRAA